MPPVITVRGIMNTAITAMHYCVPKNRLTNEELVERFGERKLKSIIRMAGWDMVDQQWAIKVYGNSTQQSNAVMLSSLM